MDPFTHLRVASGYSMQYGASHPSELVAKAVEYDMDALALTDRDGLYGAVRFAKACMSAGIAPIVGVDLAVPLDPHRRQRPASGPRTAAKGGELRDSRLPRVVCMATSRAGWAALCRLVSATHLSGDRGIPISSPELIAEYAARGDLIVMLGSDSDLGALVAGGRRDLAEAELRRWLDLIGSDQLVIAVTHHQVAGTRTNSASQAGGMLTLADSHHLTGVLTNQVRMAERYQATTVDVLDAARRLVPLDLRHVDRRNAEGWFKSGKQMIEIADEVARLAGRGSQGAERLIGDTRTLGLRCRLDPRADIGLGEVHLPDFETLGTTSGEAMGVLRARCEVGVSSRYGSLTSAVAERLDAELAVIEQLGYASYFLTVADVVGMIRTMGIRCAARGSGAGSLVNYLLGISGVDPLAYGLIMERFLSPLRVALPDIDLDVESARRTEIYERVLEVFGGERVACVAMIDTYRVRHAVRDVGAALSLPPMEIDAIAKSFPHIRARDARAALRDLPELRAAGLGERRLDVLFKLVESLDGLPRHVALHPCGVLLSDQTLGDRTPLEASFGGFPMSQFDKDDVEDLGLLKLDVLGIRMQSSMAHALDEIRRTQEPSPDIDALAPFDDADTYEMIARAQTLGCFQIESPGQRELIGKFGPENFNDVVIDISLFRPGPVKSDMVIPFLNARQGWKRPVWLHPSLQPVLAETGGVVVFHEQIIQIVSIVSGCSYAQADEVRRALGDPAGQRDVKDWFVPLAKSRGYESEVIKRIWFVLTSFASFGFCKAHAAAFALPTYQSAWLKRHYPAQFLAGVLTHDPGMYPKRLFIEEARRMGIEILGIDVSASDETYRVERAPGAPAPPGTPPLLPNGLPDAAGWGIRLSLADVKGIEAADVVRIVAGRPYQSLSDFWQRTQVDAPIVERLILAGGFDSIYGIGRYSPIGGTGIGRRGRLTRRDLLLSLADLKRTAQVEARTAVRAKGLRRTPTPIVTSDDPRDLARRQMVGEVVGKHIRSGFMGVQLALDFTSPESSPALDPAALGPDGSGCDGFDTLGPDVVDRGGFGGDVLDTFGGGRDERPDGWGSDVVATGLPEMTDTERLEAELEILGLDASRHIIDFYREFLTELGVAWSTQLYDHRNHAELLVAGVKVATQTPPVRSGRRVVFLTLDDATGPVDATFFEDAQGPYAATVFSSWLLVVRGELRRTGPRGVSLRATGAWDLQGLHSIWQAELATTGDRDAALAAVAEVIATVPPGLGLVGEPLDSDATGSGAVRAATQSAEANPRREDRRGGERHDPADQADSRQTDSSRSGPEADTSHVTRAGGMGRRRVLVHASGFKQSPYADIQPPGDPASKAPPANGVLPGGVPVNLPPLGTPDPLGMPEAPGASNPPGVPSPRGVPDPRGTPNPVEPPSAGAPRKLWHSSPGSSGR